MKSLLFLLAAVVIFFGLSVTAYAALTDNGDGTRTDNLTGLIWLQNANCDGQKIWTDALTFANSLYDDGSGGNCGLSDGSLAGDWRLPNIRELNSLIDYDRAGPALPAGHPFTSVVSDHWSSTTRYQSGYAWYLDVWVGTINRRNKTTHVVNVWPVRGGN